ncbi:probable beta-1,3-galactosyltransferase 14 isoform X2 [Salvia splendens]|uniref:probable beta-1,3-galactosyltransferase 14 isoform X2 n=1 Tax=Salvia splendens TaxID=180675 RepID=UPI001C25D411|nr:probable beta-1,3-galactosyltransferase 14 isoform X2 [Salvia splendens]
MDAATLSHCQCLWRGINLPPPIAPRLKSVPRLWDSSVFKLASDRRADAALCARPGFPLITRVFDEESTGLVFRFIIGRTNDRGRMSALKEEVTKYDDFLLIDIEEEYSKLPYKTLAFFKAAYALYDSDFYVKADDDIYLRPDRLSLLLAKERSHSQTYLGCMKKGPVFTDPKLKWYEPLGHLLGREYFLHAYGPIYALSADVVASLVALRNDSFRMFSNEDVTIGSWMLAMNVNHEDSKLLCQAECTASSIAVWDIPKCSGLCNPEKRMLELHKLETCSKSATLPSEEDEE